MVFPGKSCVIDPLADSFTKCLASRSIPMIRCAADTPALKHDRCQSSKASFGSNAYFTSTSGIVGQCVNSPDILSRRGIRLTGRVHEGVPPRPRPKLYTSNFG